VQNIKTGLVVALLLAVCYGAFKALNEPEQELPPELNEWVSNESNLDDLLDVDLGHSGSFANPESSLPNISLGPAESLTAGVDGPSMQIPGVIKAGSDAASETDSLVPDTFPTNPLDTTGSLQPAPSTNASTSSDASINSSFPSIPLPGNNSRPAEQTKLIGTNAAAGTPIGITLPLLPDSYTLGQNSNPLGQKNDATTPAQREKTEQPVIESFSAAREKALKLANDGKLKDALVLLTPQYRSPVISSAERSDLLDILDALAREVIFSSRHLLTAPYAAKATDTVESVAAQHKITSELLANVNQLGAAKALTQGQQLKVFEGPFRGEVDLTIGELTLFLKDMYACRFPISVGTDPVKVGAFEVADKQRDRTYYGAGKVIEASNPSNPYGGFWIDLGQGNCLHGSPEMAASDLTNAGCIGLSPIDASDAFIMLTQGSQVIIRR